MTPAPSGPLTAGEFSERLEALGAPRRLLLAVSGGPDSMALARLCADYARLSGAEIAAATVDHGLRDASRGEAEQAGRWCREAGLAHAILTWEGEKPAAGLQEAARNARYGLLAGHAERTGFDAVLTGHNADDQAETVFMRLSRGAGPRGLAGMDASILIAQGAGGPVRLLRPLLDVARQRITATLEAFAQPAVSDPSNDEPRFERVRVRGLLAALEEQGILTGEALRVAARRARAAANRIAESEECAFRDAGGCFHRFGWVTFDSGARALSAPAFAGALSRAIHAVSGSEFRPAAEEAAVALAAVLRDGAATLGGALLKIRGDTLFVMREPAAVLGRAGVRALGTMAIAPGGRRLWDRRFIVENRSEGLFSIAPVGFEGVAAMDERRALYWCPDEALAALPDKLFSDPARLSATSLAVERYYGRVIRYP